MRAKSRDPASRKATARQGRELGAKAASDLAELTRQLKVERNKKNKRRHDKGLVALAVFKWFKGLVLLLVGVGFLKLLHHDIETELQTLVDALRVDPDNHYLVRSWQN